MNFIKVLFLSALMVVSTHTVSFAGENDPEMIVPRNHKEQRARKNLDFSMKDLNLREDQVAMIRDIHKEFKMRADMLRMQMKDLKREYDDRVMALLDEEQRIEYVNMKKRAERKHGGRRLPSLM